MSHWSMLTTRRNQARRKRLGRAAKLAHRKALAQKATAALRTDLAPWICKRAFI